MDTHSFGYAGRILRINLTSRSFIAEPLSEDEARRWIGGRGLNVSRLFYEVPPDTYPLSPENPFIAGVGPLNGTSFPGAGRINFTARSPHTGILGDSNAGTAFSAELKYAGYDQIIITGACEKWTLLVITEKGVRFEDAEDMAGLDTIETQKTARMRLRDPWGESCCYRSGLGKRRNFLWDLSLRFARCGTFRHGSCAGVKKNQGDSSKGQTAS